MTEFCALRAKAYAYLLEDGSEHKKAKGTKKCIIKHEVNKITLSSNDDKKLQTIDKVTTYPYGTSVFKVCESEMLSKC